MPLGLLFLGVSFELTDPRVAARMMEKTPVEEHTKRDPKRSKGPEGTASYMQMRKRDLSQERRCRASKRGKIKWHEHDITIKINSNLPI